MTNTNKRCCRRNIVAIDRISTLPDDLLIHVLSFLSTREVVKTCILAKRWRNTWASVRVLKLQLHEFCTNSDLKNDERRKLCKDKFEQFIHGVLKNRGRCLDTFQYKWYINIENDYSMEWLDRVVTLMPRVINIIYYGKNMLEIPNLVFSCPSLQELNLYLYACNQITIIRPKLINLPSLKVLNLNHVDLDDDFAQKLFFGCPALESMYLCSCHLGFSDISSKVLKSLTLKSCRCLYQMQICCPSLISLDIDSPYLTRCISLKNTASLANADIRLQINEILFDDYLNILRVLSNVSTLKFDFWFDNLKGKFEKNIPNSINFNNLKTLDLGSLYLMNLTKGKHLVAFFLRHSPQLKKLTLRLYKQLWDDAPKEPSEEESVKVFQRDYLDTVRIIIWAPYSRIVKWETNDPLFWQMSKYLHGFIKKIGNIITS